MPSFLISFVSQNEKKKKRFQSAKSLRSHKNIFCCFFILHFFFSCDITSLPYLDLSSAYISEPDQLNHSLWKFLPLLIHFCQDIVCIVALGKVKLGWKKIYFSRCNVTWRKKQKKRNWELTVIIFSDYKVTQFLSEHRIRFCAIFAMLQHR